MHIFFDFEIDPALPQPKDPKNLIFETLREFVYSRYKIIEEQIDRYQTAENPAFVVLCLTEEGLKTKLFNISPHIYGRVAECITQDDFAHISGVLWQKVLATYRTN